MVVINCNKILIKPMSLFNLKKQSINLGNLLNKIHKILYITTSNLRQFRWRQIIEKPCFYIKQSLLKGVVRHYISIVLTICNGIVICTQIITIRFVKNGSMGYFYPWCIPSHPIIIIISINYRIPVYV